MKTAETNEGRKQLNDGSNFGSACLNTCKIALAQIARVRDTILSEARSTLHVQEHMLRLALNEAEGIALQTSYPQLFFPTLAEEKVREVARWNNRQQMAVAPIWSMHSQN